MTDMPGKSVEVHYFRPKAKSDTEPPWVGMAGDEEQSKVSSPSGHSLILGGAASEAHNQEREANSLNGGFSSAGECFPGSRLPIIKLRDYSDHEQQEGVEKRRWVWAVAPVVLALLGGFYWASNHYSLNVGLWKQMTHLPEVPEVPSEVKVVAAVNSGLDFSTKNSWKHPAKSELAKGNAESVTATAKKHGSVSPTLPDAHPANTVAMAETSREKKASSLSSSPTGNLREYRKWVAIGKANYDKKRFYTAVENFQNALKYQKNYADAWIFLGLSVLENSPQEAIPYLKKGLNLQPDFARGYVGLGFAYQLLDRKAEAAQEYKKYLRIDPNGPYAPELRTILMSLE